MSGWKTYVTRNLAHEEKTAKRPQKRPGALPFDLWSRYRESERTLASTLDAARSQTAFCYVNR